MKLTGNFKNLSFNEFGKPIISFEVNRTLDVNGIEKLNQDDFYNIKISNVKSSRTLRQNNLLWAIIGDIDKKINGVPTEENRLALYIDGIEAVGAEYEDIIIPKKSINIFKSAFRSYKILEDFGNSVLLRCFVGSSKFDKKQMGNLIDYFLKIASENGVTIIDYRSEYEELFWK